MKSCKFLIVFISVLLLTACMVTKPSYSGLSEKGGYTSQKIDESTYIIEFSKTANERIRIIKAVHYTYWGAAEVAIKNNKKFFKILKARQDKTRLTILLLNSISGDSSSTYNASEVIKGGHK